MIPHQSDIRVRFYELDPYGHVNHATYVQYFETGRVEALSDVDMGLDVLLDKLGVNVVVVDIRTRFLKPALLGDRLIVESGLSAVGRAKSTWAQRIMRGEETIATQLMVSGCITEAGTPTRWPVELVEALERYHVSEGWLGSSAPRK